MLSNGSAPRDFHWTTKLINFKMALFSHKTNINLIKTPKKILKNNQTTSNLSSLCRCFTQICSNNFWKSSNYNKSHHKIQTNPKRIKSMSSNNFNITIVHQRSRIRFWENGKFPLIYQKRKKFFSKQIHQTYSKTNKLLTTPKGN